MSKNIKSIILAAGKGTRMKSDTSKVLHKIFNKELLGYVIDAVNDTGLAEENYIIVGHQAEAVEKYVSENYKNAKCRLQSPQLGTGHAAYQAYEDLKGFTGGVLILCGDTPLLTSETLKDFINEHEKSGAALTVMSAIFEDPTNYGRIIRDENGNLKAIIEEKDASPAQKKIKEVNTGVYLINWAEVSDAFLNLDSNNAQNEYYLTDIVKWTINKGLKAQSYILKNNEESYGINSKLHLAQATKVLKDRVLEKLMAEGVTIVDPDTTYISPETEIEAAKRELKEEAGLEVPEENFHYINAVYPSPGGVSERLTLYVALVDASHIGNHGGLAIENEDLRIFKVKSEEAFELVRTGRINNAAALIGLMHLQLNLAKYKA